MEDEQISPDFPKSALGCEKFPFWLHSSVLRAFMPSSYYLLPPQTALWLLPGRKSNPSKSVWINFQPRGFIFWIDWCVRVVCQPKNEKDISEGAPLPRAAGSSRTSFCWVCFFGMELFYIRQLAWRDLGSNLDSAVKLGWVILLWSLFVSPNCITGLLEG